jgi:HK97 family phage prohead protease
MQRAIVQLTEFKLAPSDSGVMSFTGYGAAFNNIDAHGDVIAPGAFAKYLNDVQEGKQPWPSMLSQHGGWGVTAQDMTPVGAWTSLAEDGAGLKVEGELAPTPRGQELYALMKMKPRPAIDGLSIGFIPKASTPRSKPEDPRRTITQIDLVEISPVTFPANRNARLTSVKMLEEFEKLSEIEDFLRDVGNFTVSESKAIVARIKRIGLPDAGHDAEIIARLNKNLSIIKE